VPQPAPATGVRWTVLARTTMATRTLRKRKAGAWLARRKWGLLGSPVDAEACSVLCTDTATSTNAASTTRLWVPRKLARATRSSWLKRSPRSSHVDIKSTRVRALFEVGDSNHGYAENLTSTPDAKSPACEIVNL